MKQSSYFISCKEIGCRGNCSEFKDACHTAEILMGNRDKLDERFIRIKGDNQCWIETQDTDE